MNFILLGGKFAGCVATVVYLRLSLEQNEGNLLFIAILCALGVMD